MTPAELKIKHLNDAHHHLITAQLILMIHSRPDEPDEKGAKFLDRLHSELTPIQRELQTHIDATAEAAGIDPERPDLNPDES